MYFLIFLLFLFSVIGLIIYRSIINPMTVFNGIWFIVTFLFSLGLTSFPSQLTSRGFQAILLMILSFNGMYIYLLILKSLKYKKKKVNIIKKDVVLSKKKIKTLFNFWAVIIFFEAIYSKGLPIVWLLVGINKSYAQFGIPSLHGFANSLAWVIVMLAFIYNLESDKRDSTMIRIIAIITFVYVLLLARQTLVTGFIQLIVIYMLKRKIKIHSIMLYFVAAILLFGIAGNFRSGVDHFRYVSGFESNIPNYLMGFVWVYMYMITPVCNIDSVVNVSTELYYGLVSIKHILPTVVTNIIFKNKIFIDFDYLVNKTFNVSTFLLDSYLDFGFFGIFLVSLFFGLIGFVLWSHYQNDKNSAERIMLYAVYINIISLSFFVNMFLSLPIIIQFVYIKLFFKFKLITKKT